MFAQEETDDFYSGYDVRELVEKGAYRGIDFAFGGAGSETETSLTGGGSERSKDTSYGCRVETAGENAFHLPDFIRWLARETAGQAERFKAAVAGQGFKGESGFYIEYEGDGFKGRLDVDGRVSGKGYLNLDVKLKERYEHARVDDFTFPQLSAAEVDRELFHATVELIPEGEKLEIENSRFGWSGEFTR